MAAPKRPTHVVKHERLYLAVDGKLQHFPEGKQLVLNAKQAAKASKHVVPLKSAGTIDLTGEKDG